MKFDTLKKVAVTLKIKSRSPKSNQLFTPSQHCIYASLVKICPLVQKITPGNEISYITKGRRDLENLVKVTKKSNQLFTPYQTLYLCKFGLNMFNWFIRYCHGNEISYIKEGRCDLENWAKVTKI